MPTFVPPTVEDTPYVNAETPPLSRRLFRHYGAIPRGRSVVRIAGQYLTVDTPDQLTLALATEVYLGGHEYVVSDAVATALTAAGYTVTGMAVPAVAFRDKASNSTTSAATLAVTIPATTQVGDFMVAFAAYAARTIPTPPVGWTQLRTDVGVGTNGTNSYVFYRTAQAGDPGATLTVTPASSGRGALSLLVYSGVNTSTPIHQQAADVTVADVTSWTAPSVTTTVNGCMIIEAFAATAFAPNTNTVSGGPATERTNLAVASNFIGQSTHDQSQTTAGATGQKTATLPFSSSAVGQTVALAPA